MVSTFQFYKVWIQKEIGTNKEFKKKIELEQIPK
jgi:hypothetical protein